MIRGIETTKLQNCFGKSHEVKNFFEILFKLLHFENTFPQNICNDLYSSKVLKTWDYVRKVFM